MHFVYCAKAQVNLVLNPSFEQLKAGCPDSYPEADTAVYWNWINNTTFNPSNIYLCRGGLRSTCCTFTYSCGVPNSVYGHQNPKTGNSFISLASIYGTSNSSCNNKRDYLKGQLSSTLQAGKNYCLTFYYNASSTIISATNRFGAYVDDGTVSMYSCCKDMPVIPQAQNNPAVFMKDTMNWVKIQNSFTALGNENTITLGNFVDSATIQFQLFNSGGNVIPLYNIDDVSLIPIDLAPNAGKDTSITLGDSVYIGRPSEVGLNDDCTWYVLGNATPFATIAGMWVKPNTLGIHSYLLKQDICGMVTYDTVNVMVNPVGVQSYGKNNLVYIFPNPANNILNIECNVQNVELKIVDMLGNEIKNKTFNDKIQVDISNFSEGIYFITVKTLQSVTTRKVIVQH